MLSSKNTLLCTLVYITQQLTKAELKKIDSRFLYPELTLGTPSCGRQE